MFFKFKIFLSLFILLSGSMVLAQQKSIAEFLYTEITNIGIDSALKKYQDLKKSKSADYNFAEAELNNLGYRLLGEGKISAAIKILKLNSEQFPQSANAFDSYGEALMKNNEYDKALQSYQKVLELLPSAQIPDNLKTFLEQNAKGKIALLKNPESLVPSEAINDFINQNSRHPFGKIHPDAPPETEQWGQIVGIWKCTNHAKNNGQWVSGWPATWAFKYILDGFAIQDVWMQDIKDLPPVNANLGRHFVGTNLRIYDRVTQKWDVMWFHNGQRPGGTGNATSRFEAVFKDDQIIMTPSLPPAQGQPMRRVVFHNMQKNSFDWRSDTSVDDGQTWETQFKISAVRIK